jgi:hypothetical protein
MNNYPLYLEKLNGYITIFRKCCMLHGVQRKREELLIPQFQMMEMRVSKLRDKRFIICVIEYNSGVFNFLFRWQHLCIRLSMFHMQYLFDTLPTHSICYSSSFA